MSESSSELGKLRHEVDRLRREVENMHRRGPVRDRDYVVGNYTMIDGVMVSNASPEAQRYNQIKWGI